MSTSAFSYQFPLPLTPSEGAWCIVIALVGRADFTQQMPTAELLFTDIFPAVEIINDDWLQEALGHLSGFSIRVYDEVVARGASFSSMHMFAKTIDLKNPDGIEVEFNYNPRAQLQQLQASIHQLAAVNKLRPTILRTHLKAIAPLTVFDMKKSRYYRAPIFGGFSHKGEYIISLPILSEQ